MKHIMISIRPEYVCKILNKEKTLEIRKSVPKEVLNGEECLVEIYCTKDQNKILAGTPLVDGSWKCWNRKDWNKQQRKDCGLGKYNGKVVARWRLKKHDKFTVGSLKSDDIQKLACLLYKQMMDYFYRPDELNGNISKQGYAWHIDELEIYDKPKELSEFEKNEIDLDSDTNGSGMYSYKKLTRPFQSWGYLKDEN